MGVHQQQRDTDREEFSRFVGEFEPKLLQALVATYGPVDGRSATVDALSWAWEHWERLADVENRAGYLFRVGQSATRRYSSRPLPVGYEFERFVEDPEIEPGLSEALDRLSPRDTQPPRSGRGDRL